MEYQAKAKPAPRAAIANTTRTAPLQDQRTLAMPSQLKGKSAPDNKKTKKPAVKKPTAKKDKK